MNATKIFTDATAPEWVAALFAGLSLMGAAISFFSSRVATRNSFRLEWTRDVIGWGTRAVEAMAAAQKLCEARSDQEVAELPSRSKIICEISALIDEGRFFFENHPHKTYGAEKPPAYRGFRPVMLDYLVFVHDFLRETTIPDSSLEGGICEALWVARREFVSELQRIIEPRWLSKQANYKKKMDSYA